MYSDMIDQTAVRLVNTFGDLLSWPVTLGITGVELAPGRGIVLHTEDTGRWPDYHLDNDPAAGLSRFTLCAGFQVNGQWVMSGFFEFWAHGTHDGHLRTDSGAHPLEIAPEKGINQWQANWVYNDSWAPLNQVVPQPNQLMALLVVAGDARMSKTRTVNERSQIVTVPLALSGSWGFAAEPGTPEPPQPPTPLPPPEPPPQDLSALIAAVAELTRRVDELHVWAGDAAMELGAHDTAIKELQQVTVPRQPIAWKGQLKVLGVGISFKADSPVYGDSK